MNLIELAEAGRLPDAVLRMGIRQRLAQGLRQRTRGVAARDDALAARLQDMDKAPVALSTDTANTQHYELPTAFFQAWLGPAMKYSCCLWPNADTTLEQAEEEVLRVTAQRADIADGQHILELGCGWGAVSLWLAAHFPNTRIHAVSNSHAQCAFIEERARKRNLVNLRVTTADMNEFSTEPGAYDRIVSVEMFEHMRNWGALLHRAAGFLNQHGKLFIHVFCHREWTYFFEQDDWMGRHFFADGMMPSHDLLLYFQRDVLLERQWSFNGRQYSRTLRAWLNNLDRQRKTLMPIIDQVYGSENRMRWWMRWRLFLMACEELFAYADGDTWFVTQVLMNKRSTS